MAEVKRYYPYAKIPDARMKTQGFYDHNYPIGAVVHFTAGRYGESGFEFGFDMGYCYFHIDYDGTITQAFPLNKWGYHCGESSWPPLGKSLSSKLVGIEVACAGKLEKAKCPFSNSGVFKAWFHKNPSEYFQETEVRYMNKSEIPVPGFYHKFTKQQETSLVTLLLWLKSNNESVFSFDNVLGHDEISPMRKNDPGASLSMPMPKFREFLKSEYLKDAIVAPIKDESA